MAHIPAESNLVNNVLHSVALVETILGRKGPQGVWVTLQTSVHDPLWCSMQTISKGGQGVLQRVFVRRQWYLVCDKGVFLEDVLEKENPG